MKKPIFISNSLSTDLGLYVIDGEIHPQTICPRKVYHTRIKKTVEQPPSERQMYGLYGEYLCLGRGSSKNKQLTDLPRKKLKKAQIQENIVRKSEGKELIKGDKKIAQIRIEEQAQLFNHIIKDKQINIDDTNTQVILYKKLYGNYYLRGEFDVFATTYMHDKDGLLLTNIDLKFTDNLNNDFFNPNYITSGYGCWGNIEKLIINQALIYHELARGFNPEFTKKYSPENYKRVKELITSDKLKSFINDKGILFTYFVLAYGKDVDDDNGKKHDFVHVRYTNDKKELTHQLIEYTITAYEECETNGWKANPKEWLCKNCPIECSKKITEKEL